MNGQEYLELLKKRLTHYYDIKEAKRHTQPEFVLQAELNAADEGYFIVPDLKTYSVQHNEYLYVQQFGEPLTLAMAEPYLAYTKKAMAELKTTTEHMSSVFSLVFICEAGIEPDALAQFIKLRQHKDYCFTLKIKAVTFCTQNTNLTALLGHNCLHDNFIQLWERQM